MSVSSTTNKVSYNCNGSTTAFSTGFVFLANTDVVVTLIDSSGNRTILTTPSQYTITGAGTGTAGTVTTVSTYAAGYKIEILRKPVLNQLLTLQDGSGFPASNVNKALDRLTMSDQYLLTQIVDANSNIRAYAASNTYVNAQLATKAANSYVNAQLNTEKGRAAANSYVNSQLATKMAVSNVNSLINAEKGRAAANTYVNSQINIEKGRAAANSYVIAQINAEKGRAAANSYVVSQINAEKGRAAANTYVNAQLATKASNSYVNTQLVSKANTSQYSALVTVVAGKASIAYAASNTAVNALLATKASNTFVVSQINSEKGRAAANSYVISQVNSLKGYAASNAYVNSLAFGGLEAGDVTNTYLQTQLALKANTSMLTGLSNSLKVYAASNSYVNSLNASNVKGPASATDGALVAFDGTTGKLVKGYSSIVSVSQGGTGANSFPAYAMLVGNSAGAIVPTKPLSAGQIVIGITSGTPRALSVSGDASLASSGALTVTKTNGVAFANTATNVSILATAGTLTVPRGGTGGTAWGFGNILTGRVGGALASVTSVALGQFLTSGGVGADPVYRTMSGDVTMSNTAVMTVNRASTAEFLTGTATKFLRNDTVWAGASTVTSLTSGASVALDMSTGINFTLTLGTNATLSNPTNVKVGQSGYINIVQDATGSRTLAYGSNYKWENATAGVLSTAATARDVLFYQVLDSTTILLSIKKAIG